MLACVKRCCILKHIFLLHAAGEGREVALPAISAGAEPKSGTLEMNIELAHLNDLLEVELIYIYIVNQLSRSTVTVASRRGGESASKECTQYTHAQKPTNYEHKVYLKAILSE